MYIGWKLSALVILFVTTCCDSRSRRPTQQTEQLLTTKIIHHYVKSDNPLKLKCPVPKFEPNKGPGIFEYFWEYKPCGHGLKMTPCEEDDAGSGWVPAHCKNGTRLCNKFNLILDEPKESDSGLYRCSSKLYISAAPEVVQYYHVEVIDPDSESILFYDDATPANVTVDEKNSVLFRCHAKSLYPSEIRWAKKIDQPEINGVYLTIGNKQDLYQRLEDNGIYKSNNNIYISKLKIDSCEVEDSGLYICLIASPKSFKVKEHYLQVRPVYQSIYSRATDTTSLAIWMSLSVVVCALSVSCYCLHTRRQRLVKHQVLKEQTSVTLG